MALFGKKKPAALTPTMNLTMALVQAAMDMDQQALLGLCDSVQTIDLFSDLATIYARVGPYIKPEQEEVIRSEIEAADGPDEVKTAVRDIGVPLFVDHDPHEVVAQINKHGKALMNHPDNLWAGVVMETVFAAARINKDLDITMNWA